MRKTLALAGAATTLAALAIVPASPASAEPAGASRAALVSCYGGAVRINGTDPNWHWPPYGSAYTTSRCSDINVKPDRTVDVTTCFQPANGSPYYCNGWRTIYSGQWNVTATDVRDGTQFWLLFNTESVTGLAAY